MGKQAKETKQNKKNREKIWGEMQYKEKEEKMKKE